MDEIRRKGLAKMNEVYAWEMSDMPGDFFALTVDHLFGDIWSRPGLSMRDKRDGVVHHPLRRISAWFGIQRCG